MFKPPSLGPAEFPSNFGLTANLRSKFLDFRGLDSSRTLVPRGGTPMSTGNAPAHSYWVTESAGKPPYRQMRGFAGREQQARSGAFRHCEPAACILGRVGATTYAAFPDLQISLMIWSSDRRQKWRCQERSGNECVCASWSLPL